MADEIVPLSLSPNQREDVRVLDASDPLGIGGMDVGPEAYVPAPKPLADAIEPPKEPTVVEDESKDVPLAAAPTSPLQHPAPLQQEQPKSEIVEPVSQSNRTLIWVTAGNILLTGVLFFALTLKIYFDKSQKPNDRLADNSGNSQNLNSRLVDNDESGGSPEIDRRKTDDSNVGNPGSSDLGAGKTNDNQATVREAIAKEPYDPFKDPARWPPLVKDPDFRFDSTLELVLPRKRPQEKGDLNKLIADYCFDDSSFRNSGQLIDRRSESLPILVAKVRELNGKYDGRFKNEKLFELMSVMGDEAQKELVKIVADKNLSLKARSFAVGALGKTRRMRDGEISLIVEYARSVENQLIKQHFYTVLKAIEDNGAYNADAEDLLLKILSLPNVSLRQLEQGFNIFARMGKGCRKSAPIIARNLKASPEVTVAGLKAIISIGPEAADAVPVLIGMMTGDSENDALVIRALGAIGPKSEPAIGTLLALFRESTDEKIRVLAAESIGKIGTVAESATEALLAELSKAEENPDSPVRVALHLALSRIRGDQSRSLGYLQKTIRENRVSARAYAIEAAGTLGKDGEALVPDLVKIIRASREIHGVSADAMNAIGNLGKYGAMGLSCLVAKINRVKVWRYENLDTVIDTIGKIGQGNPRAIRTLKQMWDFYGRPKERDVAGHWYNLLSRSSGE